MEPALDDEDDDSMIQFGGGRDDWNGLASLNAPTLATETLGRSNPCLTAFQDEVEEVIRNPNPRRTDAGSLLRVLWGLLRSLGVSPRGL
eukprot:CAMPEP_0175959982 /NCGR_PEP_ID=MMETSP0108-20121206/35107_1 /TAXON_ID=195067 ORGANISM="Goniomonas pacifica, Strain CCMP1869" /NCGR_SAMPLE_ID=MMETSP0108 /ASSEMBLY_ACC=CAM_ASM_000204 /LENGTH=88 /DNA_ID=CAMNT_0017287511 /DNA_START=15 /DNA_END=282 /DNA_ORIENTATION=-